MPKRGFRNVVTRALAAAEAARGTGVSTGFGGLMSTIRCCTWREDAPLLLTIQGKKCCLAETLVRAGPVVH
jgi:hypothetical protein